MNKILIGLRAGNEIDFGLFAFVAGYLGKVHANPTGHKSTSNCQVLLTCARK
jgi:hypothetical protein